MYESASLNCRRAKECVYVDVDGSASPVLPACPSSPLRPAPSAEMDGRLGVAVRRTLFVLDLPLRLVWRSKHHFGQPNASSNGDGMLTLAAVRALEQHLLACNATAAAPSANR